MKKLLFLVAIATMSICSANAQTPVKYQGEVDLGYSIGVGTWSFGRVNLHTVQGIKVGKYFSTGLGVGVDYYHDILGSGEVVVPVYLNLKGYIPASELVSPYVSLDLGGGIGATEGVSGLSGFLVTPAVGVKVGKFKAQIGYTSQSFSDSGVSLSAGAVQFKVGMMF